MSKRRWPMFAGPPLILIAAMLLVARPEPVAEATRPITIHQISACASADAVMDRAGATPEAWWKSAERLDSAGTLLGRRLSVGLSGGTAARAATATGAATTGGLDLPPESFVSGPVDGLIVVATDDGSRSTVRILSAAAACGMVIHETAAVVRTAIIDRHDHSVLAYLIDRSTRADLGTWRLAIAPAAATEARLVAPPLGELARSVGTVWGTGLLLDTQGNQLAVQSCTDLGCLTRIFDLSHPGAAPTVIHGIDEGPMLGFAGSTVVTWAACPGYPCAILAWDAGASAGTPGRRVLAAAANAAAMTADGRRLVAVQADEPGTQPVEIDPRTGQLSHLRGLASGLRPLVTGASATSGLEVAANEIAIGPGAPDGSAASAGSNMQPLNPDASAEEVLP